jgi:drug/metabolite transporter (DMT)-like permease
VIATVGLALTGALIYGIADFIGGFASRRAHPVVVTALAAAVGVLPLLVGLWLVGGEWSQGAVLWGLVAGVAGSTGVLLLYAALAVGPMSVLSPVTAVIAAAVPVLAAVIRGAVLSPVAILSLITALVAVILVATTRERSGARLTRRGLAAAVVAGCGFGGLVLAYEQAPAGGFTTLLVARGVQVALMTVALVAVVTWWRRRHRADGRRLVQIPPDNTARVRFAALIVICGVFDAGANVLIQTALHVSDDPASLPIVGVLNSLYPLGTVLLAWLVLRERLARVQVLGLALAVAANIGLSLS